MRASFMNGLLPAILAIAVVIALVAGCGGGSKDASPVPTASRPSASPSGPPTTPASLRSALLTAVDLPTDWQLAASGETFSPRTPFCGLRLPSELDPQENVSSTFSNNRNGFVLAQYLSRYEEGEAVRVVAEYRKTIEPCGEWNVPIADGGETNYRVSVLPISGLGDQAFAFKLTTDLMLRASPDVEEPVHFEMHMILTRRSDVLNWITYGGLPAEELMFGESEGFARLADTKLADSLPSG